MVGYVALKSRGNEKSENNNPGFLAEGPGLVLPVAILSIFLFARRHNQRESDEPNIKMDNDNISESCQHGSPFCPASPL